MNNIYLLTGSNQGNKVENLLQAQTLINRTIGEVVNTSSIYETQPWGVENQDPYLNQALHVITSLKPKNILKNLKSIEKAMGRSETFKWGPRIIDIDILFIDYLIINSDILRVPHGDLENRRFTLEPLAEIAPDLLHPVLNKSVSQILTNCRDTLKVTKLQLTDEV